LSSDSHTEPPSTSALRIKAIQQLLLEKGLLPPGADLNLPSRRRWSVR
jgi:hypothetical protein